MGHCVSGSSPEIYTNFMHAFCMFNNRFICPPVDGIISCISD